MADEQDKTSKTEDPTEKRKQDAIKKGNVVKSQEVNHLLNLAGGLIVFTLLIDLILNMIKVDMVHYFAQAHQIPLSEKMARDLMVDVSLSILFALWPAVVLLMLLAIIASRIQHPFLWAPDKIKPDFGNFIKKFNLFEGLKQKFNAQAMVEFGKTLFKFSALTVVLYFLMRPYFDQLYQIITYNGYQFLELMQEIVMFIYLAVLPLVLIVAVLDFWFNKKEHFEKLKMTKQEVKDEHKQSEGSPEVKAKIRQLRMQRARERMIQAVPDADVIVTNPTHYACALKYDSDAMGAPRLLAKGVDHIALKIREVAEENDIPIVENPPLARAIYGSVEIEDEVPPEHYQAVAEVISYVMRTHGRLRSQSK